MMMLNHEQLLKLIREKVTHPATPKELEQRLKIPREQRATFKRLLKDLVARGALLETRGNRFGLADMMDVVVGRIVTHPRGFGFVARTARSKGSAAISTSPAATSIRRCTAIAWSRGSNASAATAARKDASCGFLTRASQTIVGRFDQDPYGTGFVVPFDRRLIMDVEVPRGEDDGTRSRETWWSSRSRAGRRRRAVRSDASSRCSATSTSPGVDNEIIIRKYNIPDEHSEEAVAEADEAGHEGPREGHQGTHRLPSA